MSMRCSSRTAWLSRRRVPSPKSLGCRRGGLNEQASVYVSGKDDPGKRRVFDHPGLRIMVASPEHIFAMKALAARTRDVDDLRRLAELAEVHTVDDARRLCRDFYPDEAISPRALGVLEELFG